MLAELVTLLFCVFILDSGRNSGGGIPRQWPSLSESGTHVEEPSNDTYRVQQWWKRHTTVIQPSQVVVLSD